ncbi:MAG: ester cyclase [Longispora sp.]|nr:ester cyclase [Longispora sp. (in: high G+C Gram-positive bacteria)]
MDKLVAQDYMDHSPPIFPGLPTGREGVKQAFRLFWDATPGTPDIEFQVAGGDKVVTRFIASGVHTGDLPGIPATGKAISVTATVAHRIANGMLVEKWSDKDALGLLQKFGVITLPGGAPE